MPALRFFYDLAKHLRNIGINNQINSIYAISQFNKSLGKIFLFFLICIYSQKSKFYLFFLNLIAVSNEHNGGLYGMFKWHNADEILAEFIMFSFKPLFR